MRALSKQPSWFQACPLRPEAAARLQCAKLSCFCESQYYFVQSITFYKPVDCQIWACDAAFTFAGHRGKSPHPPSSQLLSLSLTRFHSLPSHVVTSQVAPDCPGRLFCSLLIHLFTSLRCRAIGAVPKARWPSAQSATLFL